MSRMSGLKFLPVAFRGRKVLGAFEKRAQASNYRPSDLKSKVKTTPPCFYLFTLFIDCFFFV